MPCSGKFRGVTYADTGVTFFNYLSLAGDANRDRFVDGHERGQSPPARRFRTAPQPSLPDIGHSGIG